MINRRFSTYSLPCQYKRNFEFSAKEQLLQYAASTNKDEAPWQQLAWATRVIRQNSKVEQLGCSFRKSLSMGDVFDRLSSTDVSTKHLKVVSGWPSCSGIHVDQYYSPTDARVAVSVKRPNSSATTSAYFEDTPTIKQRSTSSQERRIGSGQEEWQEPPPPSPIPYDFKHFRHPRQYVDQYRESYTYAKLKYRRGKPGEMSCTSIPKARVVCLDAKQGVRSVTLLGKQVFPIGAQLKQVHEHSKSGYEGKWKRYKEPSDLVPIPEIRFIKVPLIRRSTPSIPSNANGRFAPRITGDDEIPCTLDISSATNTVVNPVAGKTRTIALISH